MSEEHEHKPEHEHKSETKHEISSKKKKNMFWTITSGILFALLILSVFTNGFTTLSGKVGSGNDVGSKEASDKTIKYVNEALLQGRMTATVSSIKDVGNLYNVKLNIGGQPVDSYITKDARLFFPQAFDLTKDVASAPAQAATSCEDMTKLDKPKVDVFYMSYCPYGVQAMKGMYPVAKLFGDKVDITPHFVVYGDYRGGSAEYCLDNGKLCSMHGVEELNEDIRQACIYKYQKPKFWEYVNCAMTDCSLSNIKTCWETCADKTGVDKKKVNECYDSEGIKLMEAEKKLNTEKDVSGSPTIFVNDEPYEGGRAPDQFKTNICCGFNNEPTECAQSLSTTGATTAGNCG